MPTRRPVSHAISMRSSCPPPFCLLRAAFAGPNAARQPRAWAFLMSGSTPPSMRRARTAVAHADLAAMCSAASPVSEF